MNVCIIKSLFLARWSSDFQNKHLERKKIYIGCRVASLTKIILVWFVDIYMI